MVLVFRAADVSQVPPPPLITEPTSALATGGYSQSRPFAWATPAVEAAPDAVAVKVVAVAAHIILLKEVPEP